MNCSAARKYIFAFADGQLDVKVNCEVLDHLKMCPECGRLANSQQALRQAISRQIQSECPPPGLREKIAAQVCSSAPPAPLPMRRKLRPNHLITPLVAAAAVALAVFVVRDVFFPANEPLVTVPRSATAASMIARVHDNCCAHADTHQSSSLPSDLSRVGQALSEHYKHSIAALAPDLSGHGFVFESANFCGVRDREGCEGGHVIYVSRPSNLRLSFFSVPRWDCLDKCGQRGIPNSEDLRWYEVDEECGKKLSILAWHDNATTYICCGKMPGTQITAIVRQVRTAMADFDHRVRLASLHRRN